MKANIKLYSIKSHPDFRLCPLCNSVLSGCHVGEYCDKCDYFNGYAWLTKKQAKKYQDKII